MCGIAGMLYFDNNRKVDAPVLKRMADTIYHRGPDDEGYYIDRNAGLCFRRLSIIDLSAGHQPITDDNSGKTIIFNGEIYNYLELRELLKKKGYAFKTATDTEAILYMYVEFGTECLQFLRGMFAFVIWDPVNRSLFCARDRFGIKPFYYYTDNEKFVFGSEIKAIMNSEGIDDSLSPDALDSYLAFSYITADLSIYKSVKKLLPGHYLLLSQGEKPSFNIRRYWNIKFEPDHSKSEDYWTDEINSCLSEAVKLHMISDVPLGAFLSGGIDSSSIVAFMAKNSGQQVKTFSIGFRHKEFNELRYARMVAKKYGCEHHEFMVEPESVFLLPRLIGWFDEPFADSSAIATYYVTKMAREFVTVVLSGDGGDELFAGYNYYSYMNKLHSFPLNFNSRAFSKIVWGGIHTVIPKKMTGKNAAYFFSKGKKYLSASVGIFSPEERRHLFGHDHIMVNRANGSEIYKIGILKNAPENDFISNMQNLDLQTFMVDSVLTKVDRTSMINSLEVRVPLLDHKFAELTFKIPSGLKIKGDEQKYIFKKAVEDSLPKCIINRSKQGFTIPLSMWFREDLNEYVKDTLFASDTAISEYFEKKSLKKLVEEYFSGRNTKIARIWTLLCLEEWLKQQKSLKHAEIAVSQV